MTPLDQFKPQGKRIHPYDLHALIEQMPVAELVFVRIGHSPDPSGKEDYFRNQTNTGEMIQVGQERFFVTTTEPVCTERGKEMFREAIEKGVQI